MIRMPRRELVVALFTAAAIAAYYLYEWRNAMLSAARHDHQFVAFTIEPNRASSKTTMVSALPTDSPTTKSLLQLHAEFRESQRCMEERAIIRGNVSYGLQVALPPHIAGCDDMKGALRRKYETTAAAAKAGDVDAQMCYLMQGYGDRDSSFRLTDAEIAEYQSLGAQYVDAAFKRGDWRVVELLGYRVVDWAGLFINLEQWKDPAREYKAHQLFLLGAGDVDPQDTDYWLATLRMPESKDNSKLTAQEMQDSDAWAQETYDKYFISQPKLLKQPRVCTAEDTN